MRKQWKRYRPTALILLLALAVGGIIGSAAAKYIYSTELKATVIFRAELAESLQLLEHKVIRTEMGDYTLPTSEAVTANTYDLMPGVDIPKDPYVQITAKTGLPAYLYIKVTDTTNAAIAYELEDHWEPLTDYTDVYYYNPNSTPLLTGTGDLTVNILKNKTITVNDTYLSKKDNDDKLIFDAYLYEAFQTNGQTASPLDVYKANNQTT